MTTPETTGLTGSSNTHARLSPSDSKRWTTCLASIAFQEANAHRIPKDDGGIYADWGTAAHEYSARVLLGESTLDKVPEEYAEVVDLYTSLCMKQVEGAKLSSIQACRDELEISTAMGEEPNIPDRVYFVEEQLALFYQPEQTGTADFIGIIAKDRVVERFIGLDLKAGAGVLYTSIESTQLAIYMFSAIKLLEGVYHFGPDTVIELAMIQPRHREGAEQQPWVLTLAELTKFCDEIEYKAIQARTGAERVREKIGSPNRDVSAKEILEAAPGLKFEPAEGDGGGCRFCKNKPFCEARHTAISEALVVPDSGVTREQMVMSMPDLTKDEKKLPPLDRVTARLEKLGVPEGAITEKYLVGLFAAKKSMESLLDDVEEYLSARAMEGNIPEGTKLVLGRAGNRAWVNEEAADTFLKNQGLKQDERYDFKVKSPTAAEEILKDKLKSSKRTATRFAELVTRSEPKKTLALASDKREACLPDVAVMPDMVALDDFEV